MYVRASGPGNPFYQLLSLLPSCNLFPIYSIWQGYNVPISPGARLGSYEILSPLGAGGMGEVYKARDTRLDRTVAIKVLPSHLADKPQLLERSRRAAAGPTAPALDLYLVRVAYLRDLSPRLLKFFVDNGNLNWYMFFIYQDVVETSQFAGGSSGGGEPISRTCV